MTEERNTQSETYWTKVAEWDWLTFSASWRRLHALADEAEPRVDATGVSVTACGRKGDLCVPGLFSRDAKSGLPRCLRCCAATGMPRGVGSPKNGNARCVRKAVKRIALRLIEET